MLLASGARTRVRSPFLMFSKKKGVGSFSPRGGLPTTQPPTSVRSFFLRTPPGSGSFYSLPITRNWKTGVCNYSNYSCNYNTAVITATETRHGRADAY